MKKMLIYEPALCCDTGVCGASVDSELLRITTVVSNLKKHDVSAQRFNLSSYPQEFVDNKDINKLITEEGVEALPATVVDGKVVKTRAYPTNEEIAELLEIPAEYLIGPTDGEAAAESCCCGGEAEQESCCCGGEAAADSCCCGGDAAEEPCCCGGEA